MVFTLALGYLLNPWATVLTNQTSKYGAYCHTIAGCYGAHQMNIFKILCVSFLIISCNSKSVLLNTNDFSGEKINKYKTSCAKFDYEDKLTPLFYKNTKKDIPEFLFNPSKVYKKLYPYECKGFNKEMVFIIKSEWRTFPGGGGDQKEVVYMEILIGEDKYKLQAESDIYWFISGSREEAIRQAITRVFKSIQKM